MKRVFIAGTPRTGSMWTYNVIRAMLDVAGYDVLPKEMPSQTPDEIQLINEAYTTHIGENQVYCIKTHQLLKSGLPDTLIITNYRDVRESMLSFIKFMHLDNVGDLLETAVNVMNGHMATTDYYFSQHTNNLKVRYDDMVVEPLNVLLEINTYLGLWLDREELERINDRFSKKNVSKLLNNLDSVAVSKEGLIREEQDAERYEAVPNPDGSFRVYDRKTSFQSNHITSRNNQEWRVFFTPEQQKAINELAAEWLERYGFSL